MSVVHKQCSKCKVEKPILDFHIRRASKDGLCPTCKPCAISRVQSYENKPAKRAYDANYRLLNVAKLKEKQARYAAKNKALINARTKAWIAKNPARHKANMRAAYLRNEQQNREKLRQWKKANPHKINANTAKRRAHLAMPSWADASAIKRIYELARKDRKHVDHIVPLRSRIVCGLHCEANLQLLSPQDNFKKNNKHWPDMP